MARTDIANVRHEIEGMGGLIMQMKLVRDKQREQEENLKALNKKIKALEEFLGIEFDEAPKYKKKVNQ